MARPTPQDLFANIPSDVSDVSDENDERGRRLEQSVA